MLKFDWLILINQIETKLYQFKMLKNLCLNFWILSRILSKLDIIKLKPVQAQSDHSGLCWQINTSSLVNFELHEKINTCPNTSFFPQYVQNNASVPAPRCSFYKSTLKVIAHNQYSNATLTHL